MAMTIIINILLAILAASMMYFAYRERERAHH